MSHPTAPFSHRCILLSSCFSLTLALALPLNLHAAETPPPVKPVAPATPATPAAPAAPPAVAGEFKPHAILADGTRGPALWPTAGKTAPAAATPAGCGWQDAQGKPVAAGQVLRVQLSNAQLPSGISQGVTTFDGQRILGSVIAYSDKDGLSVQSPLLGALHVPGAILSRVYIQELASPDEEDAPPAVGAPAAGQKDRAVYRNGDQSPSRLFFITDGVAKLKNGDDIATAPLERLSFLTFAAPANPASSAHDLLVLLTDGSRLTGDVTAADATSLTLASSLGSLKIARALIHSLWPRTAGFRLLARITPDPLTCHGQYDVSFPPRLNRTTAGQPFQAAEFNLAGIGMHSYTRAGYPVDGASRFTAFVTLDGHAPEAAVCTVRVYVDGAKKFEKDLKRSQPGEWLSVATTGGKKVELEVDFGPDQSDVGDQVDWVNAVLIQ